MKNKKMILKNLLKLRKNKRIIRDFLNKNNKHAILAIYPLCTGIGNLFLRALGLDYKVDIRRKPMFYTSHFEQKHIQFLLGYFYKNLRNIKNKNKVILGFGVIAKGKLTKKILIPYKLERDLKFALETGFKQVIIFRVGGLNKDYLKVINNFL